MTSASFDLQPSKLGTKEHWDTVYSSELTNFEEIGDEGEVWFGEDSVNKMVDWALENVSPDSAPSILEVGAGNGNLLFALCEAGYNSSKILGVDYSPDAVKLAQAIATTKTVSQTDSDEEDAPTLRNPSRIRFAVCDFLQDDVLPLEGMAPEGHSAAVWDLVLDKGTLDAIALAEKDASGRRPAEGYPARIGRVVKPKGFFLITSCNFTQEELQAKFANDETGLQFHSRVPWPTFSFGGRSGNVYSTMAFQKL